MTPLRPEPTVDHHDTDWNLLTRHLSGTASPDEEAELRLWLAADPERDRLLEELRSAWAAPLKPRRRYDVDAAWKRVQVGVHGSQGRGDGLARTRPRRLSVSGPVLLRAAAVLAVTLIATVLPSLRSGPPALTHARPMIDVVAPRGHRKALRLPDGSRVLLAAGSSLRFAPRFDGDTRLVHLDGLALFEVTSDSTRPFLVRTPQSTTRVLGTRFVVRAYAGEPAVEVAVAVGSVALGAATPGVREIALAAGQVGKVQHARPVRVVAASLDSYFGWTAGRLVIRDRSLEQTLDELERWYGVELVLAGGFHGQRLVTTTIEDEPLASVLERIALALDARYERAGDTIVFVSRTR